MARPSLTLASASPRRLGLLSQIGVTPSFVRGCDINEEPLPGELPAQCAVRLAKAKCAAIPEGGGLVLAADTVVAVGRRILPKAESIAQAAACWSLLSGRSHRVYTAVALSGPFPTRCRLVETRVSMKRLGRQELENYLAEGEWRGKAGGYAIQGMAGRFVISLRGSYSAVVGLPLYETASLLEGAGFCLGSRDP